MSKKYVYWEKQGNDRMCGLHCINSFLQGPYYSEDILANIGKEIDEREKEFLKCNSSDLSRNNSCNVLDDGFINISVLIECLRRKDITLYNVNESDLIKIISKDHHQDIGYICNLQQHWFSIRKIHNIWFILDSLKSSPLLIQDSKLKSYFHNIIEKYHVFTVHNINPYISLPMPDINFQTKNPNQFYISINQIKEIKDIYGEFIIEDNHYDYNEVINKFSNNETFKWPEKGGRKLNETDQNNIKNDDIKNDDIQIALKLSMQEYFKNLPPPPKEEEETEGKKIIKVLIKFPNKKIQRKFNVKNTLSDIFYWIEYESVNFDDTNSSLIFKNKYTLYQVYPRRKFNRQQNNSIELEYGNKIENVEHKTLEELNFEKEETFIIS